MIVDHEELLEHQARKYARPLSVWADVERAAFGEAVGSNSYTVRSQAEELGRLVAAAAQGPLLDLGTGRGWPGRLVAETHENAIVAVDIPLAALRLARSTFEASGLGSRAHVAAADARALPFASVTFGAVIHADVFC